MVYLLIGIAASFNFIIILKKIQMGRNTDAVLDFIALFLLSMMFGSTLGGMMIATIASATISVFLMTQPLNLDIDWDDDEDEEEDTKSEPTQYKSANTTYNNRNSGIYSSSFN